MTVRVWTPRVLAAEVLAQIRKHPGNYVQDTWFDVAEGLSDLLIAKVRVNPEHAVDALVECGSTACVAGWTTFLHDPKWTTSTVRRPVYGPRIEERAQLLLGLTEYQAAWLFDCDRTVEEVTRALTEISETGTFNERMSVLRRQNREPDN